MAENIAIKYGFGGGKKMIEKAIFHTKMYSGEGYGYPKKQAFNLGTITIDEPVKVTVNLIACGANAYQKVIIRLNNVDILETEYNGNAQTVQTITSETGELGIFLYNDNLSSHGQQTEFYTIIEEA